MKKLIGCKYLGKLKHENKILKELYNEYLAKHAGNTGYINRLKSENEKLKKWLKLIIETEDVHGRYHISDATKYMIGKLILESEGEG